MKKIVLDTNVLVQAVSPRKPCHEIWRSFFDGRCRFCVTTEILEEYEEILSVKTSPLFAGYVLEAIVHSPYTLFITPYYHFNLIASDPDDNKFVDCAVAAGAKFLVTEDKHYQVLKEIDFPKVEIIDIDSFLEQLHGENL